MSTALILSGGGAKGIGHVHALWQVHNRTDVVAGRDRALGTAIDFLIAEADRPRDRSS